MRAGVVTGLCLVWALGLVSSAARAEQRPRPPRFGNTTCLFFGGGYLSFEHANNSSGPLWNVSIQRYILKREVRLVRLWARGAVNFYSQDRSRTDVFAVWPSNPPDGPLMPFAEDRLREHTSDFAVRAEMLADLLHTPSAALYAGGGFVLHYLTYNNRGNISPYAFQFNENDIGPSLVAGVRYAIAKQPYAFYAEARYGRAYGRAQPPNDRAALREPDFSFSFVSALTLEAGAGLHW